MDDLAVALQVWSALMSVGPTSSVWPFRFAYLGDEDERTETWDHQMILQLTDPHLADEPDRVHYEISVPDLNTATAQVLWMGGSVASLAQEEQLLAAHEHGGRVRAVLRDPVATPRLTKPSRD